MVTKKQKTEKAPDKIAFHYLKSPLFRVIRVTGAMGGLTPQNDIVVTIYNDRLPIPDVVIHEVSMDRGLGKEIERKIKSGMVREVEAVLSVDPRVARSLGLWLLQQADESDAYRKELQALDIEKQQQRHQHDSESNS